MSEKIKNSEEGTNKEKSGDLSRREFLKDAGMVIGGTTMGSIAFAGVAGAQEPAHPETAFLNNLPPSLKLQSPHKAMP